MGICTINRAAGLRHIYQLTTKFLCCINITLVENGGIQIARNKLPANEQVTTSHSEKWLQISAHKLGGLICKYVINISTEV
jgi:hypothetical protein